MKTVKRKNVGPVGLCAKGNTNQRTQRTDDRPNRCKRWCFTWNNFSDLGYYKLLHAFTLFDIEFIVGIECGASKTEHLQGYIECPKKMRWSEIIKTKLIHWECARGSRKHNIDYCSKDGQFKCTYALRPTLCIGILRPWQQSVVDIYMGEPNGRTIHWFWENTGGVGKSALCKYMYVKYKCLVIQGGKLADIMNIIFNSDMGIIKMVLIDIPRNCINKVSYSAIECILNGMITNTKYETGVKIFNPPHVVVFANFPPDLENLSEDRWSITHI